MRNTVKELNLVLNHDRSYYFNIKMTKNIKFLTPLDQIGALCIFKLDIYIKLT